MIPADPALPRSRLLGRGVAFGLFVMLTAEVLRVFVGPNFHVVVRHRCYRCGQPNAETLEDTVHALAIRTVINLRGRNDEEEWYRVEVAAAERAGVTFVNAGLSAYAPNNAEDVRMLVRALDGSAEPILLHCHSGSDRSGLAAMCYLLLQTETKPAEARRQLHIRFGHNPWGKAGCHQRLLDAYLAWLEAERVVHTSERFRHWACEVNHD